MRHGSLCAVGLTLALAGLSAAQPDRSAGSTATTDKTTTTGKAVVENATPTPPANPAPVVSSTEPFRLGSPDPAVATSPTAGEYGHQYWVSAEYLWWRIKDQRIPPLVATGPAAFPVGFLGNPGTAVLLGNELDAGTFSGVRLRAGAWLDPCRTLGVEASFFCLLEESNRSTFSSDQFPVLTRPFTDVNPGGPNSEFLAFPGIATGTVSVEDQTKLCGLTLLGRCPICVGCDKRLDVIFGGQYLDLREELTIVETARFLPTAPFPGLAGNQFIAVDQFKTRNQFYGAVIGVDGSYLMGPLVFNLMAAVAVGNNRQTIEISGSQLLVAPDGTTTAFPGGLLALPGANMGQFTRNELSVVPQVGINVGYQLTECVQIFAGYTCLYWTNVVRPGDQIDPVLDINRIPNFGGGPAATSARPIVPFRQSDFWAQGVSIGIAFSW